MPENTASIQEKPQVSTSESLGSFLDQHPCGQEIRRVVGEEGLAEVAPEQAQTAPRPRKPR